MKIVMAFLSIILFVIAVGITVPVQPVLAADNWFENWDSYSTGQDMHGVNGWKGWDNNPSYTAYTSDTHYLSGPNSIVITGATDLVHEFSGYDDGLWCFTTWQFVPTDFVGTSSYFILLNMYQDGGPNDWATQIVISDYYEYIYDSYTHYGRPLIRNQWVELNVYIDLDNNYQSIYYGGRLLSRNSWTGDTGLTSISAVNLFAGGAAPIYYDNLSLVKGVFPPYNIQDLKSVTLEIDADGDGVAGPGDTLRYTNMIMNDGNLPAFDVIFSDVPDLNTTLVAGSVTTTQGYISKGNFTDDQSVEVTLGDMLWQSQATVTFDVTINKPLWEPFVANQATVIGSNFPLVISDDPDTERLNDPTVLQIKTSPSLPSVTFWGSMALVVLLGVAMVWVMRRKLISKGINSGNIDIG